jgi:hypothetical protein
VTIDGVQKVALDQNWFLYVAMETEKEKLASTLGASTPGMYLQSIFLLFFCSFEVPWAETEALLVEVKQREDLYRAVVKASEFHAPLEVHEVRDYFFCISSSRG